MEGSVSRAVSCGMGLVGQAKGTWEDRDSPPKGVLLKLGRAKLGRKEIVSLTITHLSLFCNL